jgi:hypothetical protein
MSFIKICFRTMRTPENGTRIFSHPNAVYLYRDEQSEDKKLRRRKMYNDTWEQDYMEFVEGNSLTLCSGLAYRRKENRLENAQRMYALIFDLDGVGLAELRNLFLRFGGDPERVRRLPMPTFLVLSGNRAAYLLCFPAAD